MKKVRDRGKEKGRPPPLISCPLRMCLVCIGLNRSNPGVKTASVTSIAALRGTSPPLQKLKKKERPKEYKKMWSTRRSGRGEIITNMALSLGHGSELTRRTQSGVTY